MGFLKGGLVLGMWMISLYVFIEPVYAQSGLYYANKLTSPAAIPGIKVGDLPTCITVNQEKNLVYICDSYSNTISVIDGSTNSVIKTIPAGGDVPNAIALDPVTNRLYVGFKFSHTVNEINTVTNSVTPIPVGIRTLNMIDDNIGHLFITTPKSDNITSMFAVDDAFNTTAYKFPNPLSKTWRINGGIDLSTMAVGYLPVQLFVVRNTNVYVFDPTDSGLVLHGNFSLQNGGSIALDPSAPIHGLPILYVADADDGSVSAIKISESLIPGNHQINATFIGKTYVRLPYDLCVSSGLRLNEAEDCVGYPDDIAVNPHTHMIYAMDSLYGFVYAINSTCINIAPGTCGSTPIQVGEGTMNDIQFNAADIPHYLQFNAAYKDFHRGIAVNPNTNMVYVTRPHSGTVAVINGTTNKLSVGVNFKIDPPNWGHVRCNGIDISRNMSMFDLGSLKCEPIANSVFPSPFSYWSVFPPIWFDSWSTDLPNTQKDHIITIDPTHFGTLVANFYVLPTEWITFFLGIAIPAAAGLILKYSPLRDWFSSTRREKNLNKYRNLIDDTSKIANRDKKDQIQLFEAIRKRIVDLYLNGNISDSQYVELNDELLAAVEKVKSS